MYAWDEFRFMLSVLVLICKQPCKELACPPCVCRGSLRFSRPEGRVESVGGCLSLCGSVIKWWLVPSAGQVVMENRCVFLLLFFWNIEACTVRSTLEITNIQSVRDAEHQDEKRCKCKQAVSVNRRARRSIVCIYTYITFRRMMTPSCVSSSVVMLNMPGPSLSMIL